MAAGRRIAVALIVAIGIAVPAAPAVAAPDRSLLVAVDEPVLTLPAGDAVNDSTVVRVASGTGGRVDVLALRGSRSVRVAKRVALRRASFDWGRSVRVPVDGLTKGGWTLEARRSDDHDVRAAARLRVGSGLPVSVQVTPSARTLYPYADRTLDDLTATVSAADETGLPLPVTGSVRLDAGKRHVTRPLRAGTATVPLRTLAFGPAVLTASVRGPAGKRVIRSTSVALAPTGVGPMRVGRSSDTVQPVADGLLDSVTLTTGGAAVAGSPAPVSGSLALSGPNGPVQTWPVPDGTPRTFTWDGRVGGTIVPGTYTATLTLHGPEGQPKVAVTTLTVSKDHLPYRVRDLFPVGDGNQQGLAVHDNEFFVATDVGNDSSRIDVYSGSGARLRSAVLPIGHGAELSFSTTANRLFAANGGPTSPTKVWRIDPALADPATAIEATFDLSSLGPNGMVAVDDASGRLLVFAGTAPGYTVSDVGLDGTIRATAGITIDGVPQGMEVRGQDLWVYTSLRGHNHLARYDLGGGTATSGFDLMNPGEGQGLAIAGDATYVGAHGPNRLGVLEPVPNE